MHALKAGLSAPATPLLGSKYGRVTPLLFGAVPALAFLAIIGAFRAADFYHRRFFDSGSAVIVYNLERFSFAVVFSWLVYALGYLIIRLCTPSESRLPGTPLERAVFGFGTGIGALHLIMLGLGVSGLYHRSVLVVLSLLVLGASGLHFGDAARAAFGWRGVRPRRTLIATVAIIGFAAVWLIAVKGLYPGGGGDYYTHYFYYYLAVLRDHGLAPNEIWYHYYYSKGAGPTFLGMLLTDPEAPEVVTYCCVFFTAVGIATLTARLFPRSLWPAFAAGLYLLSYLVPLGPADGGEFQKPHEETSALVVLVVWSLCMRLIGPREWRRACLVTASALLVGAAIMEVAAAIILALVLSAFALWSILQRKRDDASDYGLLVFIAGCSALAVLVLNYAVTGLATDEALDTMVKFANLERLNAWGVIPQLIIVAWIRDNYAIADPHLGFGSIFDLRGYMRLDFFWIIITSAVIAICISVSRPSGGLMISARSPWRLTASESAVSLSSLLAIVAFAANVDLIRNHALDSLPWAVPTAGLIGLAIFCIRARRSSIAPRTRGTDARQVVTFIGAFIFALACVSVPAAGSQTVSYLRFCGFFVPLIILFVVAGWALLFSESASQRRSAFLAVGVPCILFCAAIGTWQLSNTWVTRAFAQTIHAARFAVGKYSLATAYSHQSAGLPYGGIKPAALAAMRHVPAGNRIWSTDVDSYCMVPGCIIESAVSFKMSSRLNEIVNGPPTESRRILQSEGLNYFLVSFDAPNGIIDLLPFSRLFDPRTIGTYLGVKWTNGKVYLLTWSGSGVAPMSRSLLDMYAKRLAGSEHPWFRFRELLPEMNTTMKDLQAMRHPWYKLTFAWRTVRTRSGN